MTRPRRGRGLLQGRRGGGYHHEHRGNDSAASTGDGTPTTGSVNATNGTTSAPPDTGLDGGTTTDGGSGSSTGTTGEMGCTPEADVVSYAPSSTMAVDGSPSDVAAVDLNDDGVLDPVVAAEMGNTVRTYLGNGDGTFAAEDMTTTTNPPGMLAVGAIADTMPDVVVVQAAVTSTTRFRGNGQGSLASPVAAGEFDGIILLGDVDGDEVLDLLGAVSSMGSLAVSLGVGSNETFGMASTSGLNPSGVAGLALGDLDGNGDLDLVSATSIDVVTMLGTGTGSFVGMGNAATSGGTTGVVTGQFDDGGDLDVAVLNGASPMGTIQVFLGNGDGTLNMSSVTLPIFTAASLIAVGDVDADGDDDIATAHVSGSVGISLSDGSGGFADQQLFNCTGNGMPTGIALGDFDGDCVLDVVTTSQTSNVLCLFLSN